MKVETSRRRECSGGEATDIVLARPLEPYELSGLADRVGLECRTLGSKVFIHGGVGGVERIVGNVGETRLSCNVSDLDAVLDYLEAL